MALQPHQQRVVAEYDELVKKLVKLDDFINTNPLYTELARQEQFLLKSQRSAMCAYADILNERIHCFEDVGQ